jgi:uncharacterized protein (DUF2236 family)
MAPQLRGAQAGSRRGAATAGPSAVTRDTSAVAANDGYFPRESSVLRRVHRERVVGTLYGQRALLMQATHPLAFAGLTANTDGLAAPFRRLVHTAKTMEAIFFGTRAEADRELERVRGLHARVHGRIGEAAGRYPAGSAYRAEAPELLLWVLACLADSAVAAHERFARPLGAREREAFWQDYLLVGELFGLPRSAAPAGWLELRAYVDGRVASEDVHLTPRARELGRMVAFEIPVPALRRPAMVAINLCVLGILPARVRELYGLSWTPAHELALNSIATSLRATRPLVPRRIRRGSSAADYDLVACAEAHLARSPA